MHHCLLRAGGTANAKRVRNIELLFDATTVVLLVVAIWESIALRRPQRTSTIDARSTP